MPHNGGLFWLKPPYQRFEPFEPGQAQVIPGTAVTWILSPENPLALEFQWVIDRPRGVCLAVILPPPLQIGEIANVLRELGETYPNAVLPAGGLASPSAIRHALAGLPNNLPRTVTNYLVRTGTVTQTKIGNEIRRIFELAPKTSTVNRLCRDLYLSRRTLGRHFEACGLPVPSHWLQFARLLNVILRAQSERLAVFKIALSAGYPDGFTLSNQLKRMTGFRPSQIRNLIGFEWLVERWLDLERNRAGQQDSNYSSDSDGDGERPE